MSFSTSSAADHAMYPTLEPHQVGQQPQLPPRLHSPSPVIEQGASHAKLHAGERLYPQQPSYMASYAPTSYHQFNSYRGGQQSTPPDSPTLGSPPSPPQVMGISSSPIPSSHMASPVPRAVTPDHYAHHQGTSTSTTPSGSPQLYSATPAPAQQRTIYSYGASQPVNGAARPYFAQPQAVYHPVEQQNQQRVGTPQPYYQNQQPPQVLPYYSLH